MHILTGQPTQLMNCINCSLRGGGDSINSVQVTFPDLA